MCAVRKALRSAGFTLEQEPRTVCPSRADSSIKYQCHPGRHRKVVSTSHYWVVAFRGLSSISEVKGAPFGVFDQYSYLNATVLSGCPMTRPSDRLANKDGEYVRYFEKHIGESLEILARSSLLSLFSFCFTTHLTRTLCLVYQQYFSRKKSRTHRGVERGAPVLDFCCGTAPIALACLFQNQAHCVINDRDESIWVDVEARLRALVYTLMQSDKWPAYARSGYPVHGKHNGNDFYKLFRCALGQVNAEQHIVFPPDNIPTKCTAAEYAEHNGCVVQDDPRGVFCAQGPFLPEGTELPLFGHFKTNKFQSLGEVHNLHTIELRATKGKSSKPIFIRISDQCPWKLVRCDKDYEQCNCTLVENTSVSFWEHNRACLQLTCNVAAGDELVCHSFEPAGGTVRLGLGRGGHEAKKEPTSHNEDQVHEPGGRRGLPPRRGIQRHNRE